MTNSHLEFVQRLQLLVGAGHVSQRAQRQHHVRSEAQARRERGALPAVAHPVAVLSSTKEN
jgi:hypothetical protein